MFSLSTKISSFLLFSFFISLFNNHNQSGHPEVFFNPIQDGGGPKRPSTSFFPVNATNVGIIPKTFLTFSPYLVSIPNYWTWTQITPEKNWLFCSNPYKILRLLYFFHRNVRVTKLWSHDHIYNLIWVT